MPTVAHRAKAGHQRAFANPASARLCNLRLTALAYLTPDPQSRQCARLRDRVSRFVVSSSERPAFQSSSTELSCHLPVVFSCVDLSSGHSNLISSHIKLIFELDGWAHRGIAVALHCEGQEAE